MDEVSRLRRYAVAWALLALGASACSRGSEPHSAPTAAVRVFVSNETAGTVAIVDPATGVVEHVVAVGKRPRGLKLSRDGRQLFVALSGSPIAPPGVDESTLPPPDRAADGIGVVDLATRTLVRTYPSGQDPESFDLSLDGKTLYVSNEETAEMSVLDLATGTIVARVPVGEEPEGVTVRPDGRAVYVTSEADGTVVAIDTSTRAVIARVPTAKRPRSIVFTPDGATMFVTGETGNAVSVVDVATHTVTSNIVLGEPVADAGPPRPMGAVLSPDGRRAVRLQRARTLGLGDRRRDAAGDADVCRRRRAAVGHRHQPRRPHGLHGQRPVG